jgi:hypothetical protein
LSFEANQGQTNERVKFLSRGRGYTLFLTGDEAVFALRGESQKSKGQKAKVGGRALSLLPSPASILSGATHNEPPAANAVSIDNLQSLIVNSRTPNPESQTPAVLRMKLVGANPKAKITGLEELPGKSNYFLGSDPKKWRTNVVNYAKVKYEGVYPGIDLVYYGNQRQLEYDFVVAPGADPGAIAFEIETGNSKLETGNSKLETRQQPIGNLQSSIINSPTPNPENGIPNPANMRIDPSGDLVISTDAGDVRFHKPTVYQPPLSRGSFNPQSSIDNRQFVDGRFVLTASNQVRFELGPYDKSRPLIIDPYVSYLAYLGGSGWDAGGAVAVDASGNAYVTGISYSTDFPVTLGGFQTIYAGGTFDAFVSKINPTGSALVYSTFLGGSLQELGEDIAVDTAGNAYVLGDTNSSDFPTTPGAFQSSLPAPWQHIFMTKLNTTGDTLVYSTLIGGSGVDEGRAVAIDASDNAYVTGRTQSPDFPTTPGAFQTTLEWETAIVTKLNANGSGLLYSTFLGPSRNNNGLGIAVDAAGSAFVTGYTNSANFPTTPGAFQTSNGGGVCNPNFPDLPCDDGFLTKVNVDGTALVYSTYLGGSAEDYAFGVAVDTSGGAYVTGYAQSSDFPTTLAAFQPSFAGGSSDIFVTRFNAAGSALVFSTYLGGSGDDVAEGIGLDSSGNAWVTGPTSSSDFPVSSDAIQPGFGGGGEDVFITGIASDGSGLVFSSYLGGSGDEFATSVFVDSSTNIYVTGETNPSDFLVTTNNFNKLFGNDGTYHGGLEDAFVLKISPDVAPQVGVSQISVTYPDQPAGTTSPPTSMVLGNFASAPIDVTTIQVVDEYGSPSADFTVDPKGCIKTFAVGEKCTVDVYFTPTSGSSSSASLLKFAGRRGPSAIRGHPRTPPRLPTPRGTRTGLLSLSASLDVTTNEESIPLTGDVVYPLVSLSPSGLNFSAQPVGLPGDAQPVTLTNVGEATLNLSSLTVAGANSNDFHVENYDCGASLAVDASCAINVSFAPTAGGPRKSALVITDDAPESPQRVILTGIGSALSLAPSSWNFGSQTVGTTSPPKAITLTNLGSTAIHVWNSAITGTDSGDFGLVNACPVPPATLGGGAHCTISVQFTPAGIGTRTASLMISHDGGASPSAVALSGTGTAALSSPAPGSGSSRAATPRPADRSTSGRGATNGQFPRRLRSIARDRR